MEDYLTLKPNTEKCGTGQMKGKNVSKLLNGESRVCWGVIAHCTAISHLVLEAGAENLLGLGCVLPALSLPFSALTVPECLLPPALPEDPLSPATFFLPAKLSVK